MTEEEAKRPIRTAPGHTGGEECGMRTMTASDLTESRITVEESGDQWSTAPERLLLRGLTRPQTPAERVIEAARKFIDDCPISDTDKRFVTDCCNGLRFEGLVAALADLNR